MYNLKHAEDLVGPKPTDEQRVLTNFFKNLNEKLGGLVFEKGVGIKVRLSYEECFYKEEIHKELNDKGYGFTTWTEYSGDILFYIIYLSWINVFEKGK